MVTLVAFCGVFFFSSLAGILREGLTIYSPSPGFFFFFKDSSGDQLTHTNSTFFLGPSGADFPHKYAALIVEQFIGLLQVG